MNEVHSKTARQNSGGRLSCNCNRRWKPLDLVWVSLAAGYLWLAILILFGRATGHVTAPDRGVIRDERYNIDLFSRRAIAAFACCATTVSMIANAFTAAYVRGKKFKPVIAALLFYVLVNFSFALDAINVGFRPFGIELYNYAIHIITTLMTYSSIGTLVWMRHGEDVANAELVTSNMYSFILWTLPIPAPLSIIVLSGSRSWAVPVAIAWVVVNLAGYAVSGTRAARRLAHLLNLHWTVLGCGVLTIVAWLTTFTLHFCLASGVPGITIVHARAVYVFTLVLNAFQVGLTVSQAIDSFEESVKFKAERDAANAELLVRLEQQKQAQAAEEARQKFLRYVFHEIRVPFNSIDMGLSMLMEDLRSWQQEQRRRGGSSTGLVLTTTEKGAKPHAAFRRRLTGAASSQAERSDFLTEHHRPEQQLGGVQLPLDAVDTLETLSKASASMKVIINDTLDWTKLQSGAFKMRPTCTDIRETIGNTIEGLLAFVQHSNVQVVQEIDDAIPQLLFADSVRLQQVVANYLSNAVKFAPANGSGVVTLRVRLLEEAGTGGQQAGKDPMHKATVMKLLQDGQCDSSRQDALPPFDTEGVWWKEQSEAPMPDKAGSTAQGGSTVAVAGSHGSSVMLYSVSTSTTARGGHDGTALGALTALYPEHAAVRQLAEAGYRLCPRAEGGVSSTSTTLEDGAGAAERRQASRERQEGYQAVTLVISVKDNGEGIPASEAPMLFNAFRQLDAGMQYKGKGTGLGLAICHEIVSLHGGRVGVRSSGNAGEGAEFLLALRLYVLERCPPTTQRGAGYVSSRRTQASARGVPVDVPPAPAAAPLARGSNAAGGAAASAALSGTATLTNSSRRTGGSPFLKPAAPVTSSAGSDPGEMREGRSSASAIVPSVSGSPVAPHAYIPMHNSTAYRAQGQETQGTFGRHVFIPTLSLPGLMPNTAGGDTVEWGGTAGSGALTGIPSMPAPPGTPALHSPSPVRVLVVDDIADNRKLLRRALGRRLEGLLLKHEGGCCLTGVLRTGVSFDEAEDGHIAVEMVANKGAGHYDVITMDAEMPTMSGFLASEQIRHLGYCGLLYGCTGNALEEDQALFREKGANFVFIKPLDLSALTEAIWMGLGSAYE